MNPSFTTLIDTIIPTTLDEVVAQYSHPNFADASVELWTFDSPERRQIAEKKLRTYGVNARIRSAYKPLVHAFLEEIDLSGVTKINVHYPVLDGVTENRFRLECYPVDELVGTANLHFLPQEITSTDKLIHYRVELFKGESSNACSDQTIEIAAPNHFIKVFAAGDRVYANTGWCRISVPAQPNLSCDAPLVVDMQKAFSTVIETLENYAWPSETPYFEKMAIRIEAPFYDHQLPSSNDIISVAEAMHEDIYFSSLEVLKKRAGKHDLDRGFQPGQIVPEIIVKEGPIRVCITTGPDVIDQSADESDLSGALTSLETVEHWLQPNSIKAHLDAIGGAPFEVLSQRGRKVWGTHFEGPKPSLVISAGQHPNETTGPVGALRAAAELARLGTVEFALSPLDNPDGYALFRQLCANHPHHMHHASRYTASGGDLEYLDYGFENKIRHLGREKTDSSVHLNLHGYPAHEWTRPFTGYIPRGFDLWTIPKGFFLILRYWAGWEKQANIVLNEAIAELSNYDPIVELTQAQLTRYKRYVPDLSFEVRNGFPVFASEVNKGLFPITIITEAPDETIYGKEFVINHTAQMKTILGAAKALSRIDQ